MNIITGHYWKRVSFMDEFKGHLKWQVVVIGRLAPSSVSSPCVFLVNVNRFPIATIAVK